MAELPGTAPLGIRRSRRRASSRDDPRRHLRRAGAAGGKRRAADDAAVTRAVPVPGAVAIPAAGSRTRGRRDRREGGIRRRTGAPPATRSRRRARAERSGPTSTISPRDAKTANRGPLGQYMNESIVSPNAYIVPKFAGERHASGLRHEAQQDAGRRPGRVPDQVRVSSARRSEQAVSGRGVVAGGQGPRLGRHADMVAGERLAPDVALLAGVRPIRPSTRLDSRRRLAVVVRGLVTSLGRHAHMVVRAGIPPDVAFGTGVRTVGAGQREPDVGVVPAPVTLPIDGVRCGSGLAVGVAAAPGIVPVE